MGAGGPFDGRNVPPFTFPVPNLPLFRNKADWKWISHDHMIDNEMNNTSMGGGERER